MYQLFEISIGGKGRLFPRRCGPVATQRSGAACQLSLSSVEDSLIVSSALRGDFQRARPDAQTQSSRRPAAARLSASRNACRTSDDP
jgi:hypothetical protein